MDSALPMASRVCLAASSFVTPRATRASEKYRAIVDKYKSEKWGIYDDTADLYRAIKLSDAYYGSQSSLIALFKEMKKPVLIQNNSVLYEVN